MRRYKRYFHKFIETRKNRRQLKYITKTSCYKSFRKKDRDKRYIKNLRPISLLNIDTKKIISKAFPAKRKAILPYNISSNQTAYVEKRCISESGRLISDIMEICDKENIPGYLVTELEKVFNSLDHDFLLCASKNFGFGDSFINWIKILLND